MAERKRRRHLRRELGRLPGLVLACALGILPGAAAGQTVTEIALPVVGSAPIDIVAGPDESVWITPAGVVTEFPVPTPGSSPYGIAAGPDGNIWFTEFAADKVGRLRFHRAPHPCPRAVGFHGPP